MNALLERPAEVIDQIAVCTTINGTEYEIHSRIVALPACGRRCEYRVLLGELLIRDWTEGEIAPCFAAGKLRMI